MSRTLLLVCGLILLIGCAFWIFESNNKTTEQHQKLLAEAGHLLFFDTRISFNNTKSCASCHAPQFAFSDGYRKSVTATGDNVLHNSPSLINIRFHHFFDWANPSITSLEQQHRRPIFNLHPVELGATGNENMILNKLRADTVYTGLFRALYPNDPNSISFDHIIQSIAAYVKTLVSKNSPYDRYTSGDSSALNSSAIAGMQLFFSPRLQCASCHPPPYFTTATLSYNTDSIYINTGLYNINNTNQYPSQDNGLTAVTHLPKDDGRFKIPSLRNVSMTAPYMHDGSINSLEEVIDMYRNGGRLLPSGDGRINQNKDKRIHGFQITATEEKNLISFLYSLTDSSIITNPQFQNPFTSTNN